MGDQVCCALVRESFLASHPRESLLHRKAVTLLGIEPCHHGDSVAGNRSFGRSCPGIKRFLGKVVLDRPLLKNAVGELAVFA